MKLSKSEHSTLLLALAEAIPNVQIYPGGLFLMKDRPTWTQKTNSAFEGDFAANLQRQLDDGGLSSFLLNEIQFMFFDGGNKLPPGTEGVKAITAFPDFSDPLAVARRLVDRIKLLPVQYRLVTRASPPLSDAFESSDIEVSLSNQLRLLSGSRLPETLKLSHPNRELNKIIRGVKIKSDDKLTIKDDALYFEFRTSGHVSDRNDARLARDFSDQIRAFYGVCLSANIFHDWGMTFSEEVDPVIAINELDGEESTLISFEAMDTDLVKATNIDTSSKAHERIKGGEEIADILMPVIDMFGSQESAKLTTAAVWLLRAHLSARGMDKILESTIAIEVLLGDRETSDRVGLGKLMGNRCAYSLGRTAVDRKEMTDFFTRFYKVRSEIVHSGRLKLSHDEKEVVTKGLALASRILLHEIKLAKA